MYQRGYGGRVRQLLCRHSSHLSSCRCMCVISACLHSFSLHHHQLPCFFYPTTTEQGNARTPGAAAATPGGPDSYAYTPAGQTPGGAYAPAPTPGGAGDPVAPVAPSPGGYYQQPTPGMGVTPGGGLTPGMGFTPGLGGYTPGFTPGKLFLLSE